jgi:hypothetical protein
MACSHCVVGLRRLAAEPAAPRLDRRAMPGHVIVVSARKTPGEADFAGVGLAAARQFSRIPASLLQFCFQDALPLPLGRLPPLGSCVLVAGHLLRGQDGRGRSGGSGPARTGLRCTLRIED